MLKELCEKAKRLSVINRLRKNGITIPCCDGVVIDPTAVIGKGTKILPGTIIKEACTIGMDCIIGPNTVLGKTTVGDRCTLSCVHSLEAQIKNDATLGPFVNLRPGTVLESGVHCFNFVEIKYSVIGEKTHIAHLTYVGDSDVGKGVNFGCGTVTVNFNGKEKNRCKIGDDAFIGCNTNLIAPVTLGDRAYTAAGSTITDDVPPDALAVARQKQLNKIDWVKINKPYRNKK